MGLLTEPDELILILLLAYTKMSCTKWNIKQDNWWLIWMMGMILILPAYLGDSRNDEKSSKRV